MFMLRVGRRRGSFWVSRRVSFYKRYFAYAVDGLEMVECR